MRALIIAVLLSGFTILPAPAHASSPWDVFTGTVARLWKGTARLPLAAVRNWRISTPLLLATGALIFAADTPITQRIQSPGLERTSKLWSNRGLLEIEPAFALTAAAIENHCLLCRSTGTFTLTALIAEGYMTASVQTLKYAAGRERPYTPLDGDGGFNESGTSFPSGHSAGVFTLAALLSQNDPQAHWINGAAFLLAGGVGAARITAKEHFPSDVFVGATIGILVGRCAAQCPGQ